MKQNIIIQPPHFSLHIDDNYKQHIDVPISVLKDKYTLIVCDYLKYITEKFKKFSTFIIIQGFETITNSFNYIFYYTKNIDLTYYHIQKSFYLYVEFIDQITEEQHTFLQLGSKDASMYVYKKLIYDIKIEYCKPFNSNDVPLLNEFNTCTFFTKKLVEIIVCSSEFAKCHVSVMNLHVTTMEKFLYCISTLKLEPSQLRIANLCVTKFTLKNINIEKYFDILHLLIKKICVIPYLQLNTKHILCMLNDDDFMDASNDYFKNTDKLTNYLLNEV
jgi:hypothetical protein